MGGRRLMRFVAAAQVALLAAALVGAPVVAASTLGFTLTAPSVSTLAYSDLVTLRGTYTCLNDGTSNCATGSTSQVATFSIRPSGGTTFSTVASVSSSVVFASSTGGCPTTCSVPFQVVWRAGRAGAATVAPGLYDLRLTTTIAPGELVADGALTIVAEGTTTTYAGATSGVGGDPLALGAAVVDLDRGQSPGTGIITPDTNLGGAAMVEFALYDAANTTLVAGPVSATLLSGGGTTGSPSLLAPLVGGSFRMRTTYAGNGFYVPSADLDVITIAPSNTAPVLVLPGSTVVAEATSAAGAVVEYTVGATDAEDEPDPPASCWPLSGETFPLGDTLVSCSVTDSADATTTDSFTVRVQDTTRPTVLVTTAESSGSEGWFNAASNDAFAGVTIDVATGDLVGVAALACTDNGTDVGALDASGDSFVVGDGAHQVSCTATDAAGNSAGDAAAFDVDQAPPLVTGSLSPDPGSSGWWNIATGAPTVRWSCSDATSGAVECSEPFTFGEGLDLGATGTATDAAGNVGTGVVTGVDVDVTAPSVLGLAGTTLAGGGMYDFGSVPPEPTGCAATDAGSGPAACTTAGYELLVGSWSVSAIATDVAGNGVSATFDYAVLSWTLSGFDKPLEMTGLNDVKAGTAVQLKFSIDAGATDVAGMNVVAAIDQATIACPASGPKGHGPAPRSAPTHKLGTSMSARWDAPSEPGTCWLVTLQTIDGSSLSASFRLR